MLNKYFTWKRLILVVIALLIIAYLSIKPSNNRQWNIDQQVLPEITINGGQVSIKNIRNFTYRTKDDYTPGYYDKTFDLAKLKNVYYVVEPFSGHGAGAAHTLLSFEFEPGNFVAISVEIRKEIGETFSPWKGLLKQYELMYVIGDERDLIKLRSNYRHDQVYLYPMAGSIEKKQALFLDMLARAQKLQAKPEFYNTIFSTCTTNLVAHLNKISPNRVPFSFKVLMPAYSDELAYDLGLIDTDLTFFEAQQKYLINDRALKYADNPNWSVRIRQ